MENNMIVKTNEMFGDLRIIMVDSEPWFVAKDIAEKLGYEGPVLDYVDRQSSRINFSCVVIYRDLIELGGSENKSLTIKFPKVPKEYLSDFIRGYFDGDGCVMNLKGGRINSAFTCGNKEFLKSLLSILKEDAGIEGGSFDDSCSSLKFGKRDTIRLGNYIYGNNPELFLYLLYAKVPLSANTNSIRYSLCSILMTT